jgi:hypothetical protein
MAAITSGQQVLLPESTNKQRRQRQITVEVNTIDRSRIVTYDTNNFRWEFRRPLKDITAIELVSGCIPADLYNVTEYWNKFVFGELGHGVITLALTPGQYTATSLAAELQTQLNGNSNRVNTYAVTYSNTTKKLTITATNVPPNDFMFYFQSGQMNTDQVNSTTGAIESINSPAKLLGFDLLNTLSIAGVIEPPYRVDVDYCIKKVYLHINADNSKELNRIEVGSGRRDCFHILFLSHRNQGYFNLNRDTYMPIYYSAPAPISRMSYLTISLRDEFFRPIDLGNHEYSLVFEITVLD